MINPRLVEGNRLKAIEFSKDWWEITEKGHKKKYYFDVYFNPVTAEVQIGEFQTTKQKYPEINQVYSLWRSLGHDIIKRLGVDIFYRICFELTEESADLTEIEKEIHSEDFTKKLSPRKEWIRFSGGSEQ